MAVDFDNVDRVAATVAALYGEAELALTRRISRQLGQGLDAPGWATAKLGAVGSLRRAAQLAVAALTFDAFGLVRRALAAAYRGGWGDELATLADQWAPTSRIGARARAAQQIVPGTRAIEALADSLVSDLRGVHERITRQTVDTYRAVIGATVARTLTGVETRREAAQAAWSGLTSRGLVRFTDRSGRDWQLSSYVEMATRTVTARAATQGHIDALREIDARLVVVSDHPQECALCRPWEGTVLALWGDAGVQVVPHAITGEPVTVEVAATLAQARELGLDHPNCRHDRGAYFPGVTRLRPGQPDPEGDKARQRQRYLERRIRAAKMAEAAALDDAARTAARRKVRAAQQALREHLAAHPGLKRLRYREQLGAGNVPPAGRRDPAGAIGPDVPQTLDGQQAPAPTPRPEPAPTPEPADLVEQTGPDLFDPSNTDPLDGLDLVALPTADLFALWDAHPEAYDRIAAEMDRRDQQRADLVDDIDPDAAPDTGPEAAETLADLDGDLDAQQAHHAEQDARDREQAEQAAIDLRIDQLVARGWDYREAYAEVFGLDADELARQERAAAVDADRRAGETREQAVRRQYAEWVDLQYLAAEEATRGHMLTKEAEARGIDPYDLFSGPAHVARANASEDLLRWWADNGGRRTYTEFRAEILGRASDIAAAEQIRGRGNDRDFGV